MTTKISRAAAYRRLLELIADAASNARIRQKAYERDQHSTAARGAKLRAEKKIDLLLAQRAQAIALEQFHRRKPSPDERAAEDDPGEIDDGA